MQALQIQNEAQYVATVSELCGMADDVVIMNGKDVSDATDLAKLIKTRHKEIEGERTGLVKPLNDTVDKINGRFKAILSPLKIAEDGIKSKILTFQQEEGRKAEVARREAERLAAEEAKRVAEENKGPPVEAAPIVVQPPSPPKTIYGQSGSSSTIKKMWTFDLVNIAELAAARPDLVMVDTAKVNALIRGCGGAIPGLNIYEKDIISIR